MKRILIGLGSLILLIFVFLIIPRSWEAYKQDQYERKYEDPPDTMTWLYRSGGDQTLDYQAIKSYCTTHVQCIADFRQLFPNSRLGLAPRDKLSHYTEIYAETMLYGRYDIWISQHVRTNKANLTATSVGNPRFVITEIAYVLIDPKAGMTISHGNSEYLGLAEWNRFLEAKGDLSSVMSNPIKGHPIPLAKEYQEAVQGWN